MAVGGPQPLRVRHAPRVWQAPGDAAWRPPQADDWEHRRVIVRPGERTCLVCGETLSAGDWFCWNCDNSDPAKMIDSTTYLLPEEYEVR